MEAAKTKRKGVRIAFTSCVNKIEEQLSKTEVDQNLIGVLSAQLEDKFVRLEASQEEVEKEILSLEDSEKLFEEDFATAEEYRDRYIELSRKLHSLNAEREVNHNFLEKKQFKLPKLELKRFSGEAREYLGFWSQFSKINDDVKIPPEDKFQYLLQAVIPDSKAARLVESFPPTAENYPKVIEQLKERFGRSDLLVQIYVRDLLSMVMKNAVSNKTKTDLVVLYDELETKIRALDSLGRTKEKYGDFLTPLVESCLPENILITWERNRNINDRGERSLENLMSFLRQEVQGQEMVVLARTGFGASKIEKQKEKEFREGNITTAAALVSTSETENQGKRNFDCLFCTKKHPSQDCYYARKMSLDEKKRILTQKFACFACLKGGHISRNCKSKIRCFICNKYHLTLMCPNKGNSPVSKNEVISTSVLSNNSTVENVYLMTLVVKVINQAKQCKIRAVLDTGSQRSYLSSRIIKQLKLKPKRSLSIIHGLFGGKETKPCSHEIYDVKVASLNNNFSCEIEVLSENKICGFIPKLTEMMSIHELNVKGISLSDFEIPSYEVDLLIGSDIAGVLLTGKCVELESGLVAIETRLGYTVIGKEKFNDDHVVNKDSILCALSLNNLSISELWNIENLGILDPIESVNKNVEHAVLLNDFKESLKILPSGRYELNLPFKTGTLKLPINKELTWNRHQKMCQRTRDKGLLQDYEMVFKEWEHLNIIEKVPQSEIESGKQCHYLPHRPVVKAESVTTKLRPVFDASSGKPSLNDFLYKGPNLIELIPDLIDRFRIYPIGLSADIEKAFLQLSIAPECRDFLRFFYPCENEMIIFRHCRVVFGATCSPFLLAASISHLLNSTSIEHIEIMEKLRKSFYVDNCISGVLNVEEQKQFILTAKEVLSRGCFNLRGWESNVKCELVSKSSGITNVLGILWNLDNDTLKCNINVDVSEVSGKITKRVILATVQKIFDPIGLLSAAILPVKIKLQDIWKLKVSWDTPLPPDIQKSFQNWKKDLSFLNSVEIARYAEINDSTEMHVFVDASKVAYAACVFLRTVTSSGIKIHLLRAKSRVAPLKPITIPRLELLSCTIGVRLSHSVKTALNLTNLKTVFWSDSMVSLWWIRERGDWTVFVSNRVKEIKQLALDSEWRHVPGTKNPADLLSRGCPSRQFSNSRWWEGPAWLRESRENWPENKLEYESNNVESELKRMSVKLVCNFNLSDTEPSWYAVRFSNFNTILRLLGWILRFIHNARQGSANKRNCGDLTSEEIELAEKTLIRLVQGHFFPQPNSLKNLNVFKDDEGILRIKTRITERIDKPEFLSPILLPDKSIFTQRLIEQLHVRHCHAGTQILLNLLRSNYWIIKGRKTVRAVVKKCVPCRRFKSKPFVSDPVTLPADRVKDASVFEVTGIDLAGPLYIKHGNKVWVVLFTCAIYRAVHLELVSSLSTEAFLMSLRRFIARRGRPRIIYSDNGTNFHGANEDLRQLNWEKITRETTLQRISWKFNPPTASWWGGFWERLIRVLKDLLKSTLGKAVLTYEELLTILTDCESVINARPLTYLSEDVEDLKPLTPAMFLLNDSNISSETVDIDEIEAKHFRIRIKHRAKINELLKLRFRKEYLGQLIQRKSQKCLSQTIEVGEIVLVGDDFKKRLKWPLAKVIQLIPGKDGIVRTVKLKTETGVLVRPIQRIFPLEISATTGKNVASTVHAKRDSSSDADEDVVAQESKTDFSCSSDSPETFSCSADNDLPRMTRTGRLVKIPKRLNLFSCI